MSAVQFITCRCVVSLSVIAIYIDAMSVATADDDPSERQIQLEGQSNFRDLGGYETEDGRTILRGQLFRSGELSRLTDADVMQLSELEIRTVVNFLTDEEIELQAPFARINRNPLGHRTTAYNNKH